MRVLLKLPEEFKEPRDGEQYCVNNHYLAKEPISVFYPFIHPIPEEAEIACSLCGNKSYGLTTELEGICADCLNEASEKLKIIEESEKALIIPSILNAAKRMRFEWQLIGKDTFYSVKGANIVPDSIALTDRIELNKHFIELMTKLLSNENLIVEAEYEKETKKLTVYL
jgi:hypothetical protein